MTNVYLACKEYEDNTFGYNPYAIGIFSELDKAKEAAKVVDQQEMIRYIGDYTGCYVAKFILDSTKENWHTVYRIYDGEEIYVK